MQSLNPRQPFFLTARCNRINLSCERSISMIIMNANIVQEQGDRTHCQQMTSHVAVGVLARLDFLFLNVRQVQLQ